MPQREICKSLELGEIVSQCCVTGKVKVPSTGEYVGFRFEKPYNRVSHTYSPEVAEDLLKVYEILNKRKKIESECGGSLNYSIGW